MTKLALYESALCCSTVCADPSVDEKLIRITGIMQQIKKMDDKQMIRYNLASNPNSFANKRVTQMIQEKGIECLPISVLDGETVVKTGDYPTNDEISEWLDVPIKSVDIKQALSNQKG
ncbi:MAG: arsenic metallochaperone ArsD family protein [Alkalibacterium sp.]|nr:arsenic metallochaperone ArsD family protein [Alkalibacterium sp.]